MAPWVKKPDKTSRPAGAKEPPTRCRDDTYPLTGSPAFAPVGRRIVCASVISNFAPPNFRKVKPPEIGKVKPPIVKNVKLGTSKCIIKGKNSLLL